MFNWRMCFPLKYMPEEKVMLVEKKVRVPLVPILVDHLTLVDILII